MSTSSPVFQRALGTLLTEVFDGPPGAEAYILNPGDPGLLRQLDSIPAGAASAKPIAGRSSIAAHVHHVHFGLNLLTRYARGEANPWADADWDQSWQHTEVSDARWQALRDALRQEARAWQEAVAARTEWTDLDAAGALSSLAHTAYHLGAIRQLLAAAES